MPKKRSITYRGKTQSVKEWARELGIKYSTLSSRFKAGWSVDKAFTTDVANYGTLTNRKLRVINFPVVRRRIEKPMTTLSAEVVEEDKLVIKKKCREDRITMASFTRELYGFLAREENFEGMRKLLKTKDAKLKTEDKKEKTEYSNRIDSIHYRIIDPTTLLTTLNKRQLAGLVVQMIDEYDLPDVLVDKKKLEWYYENYMIAVNGYTSQESFFLNSKLGVYKKEERKKLKQKAIVDMIRRR